MNAYEIRANQVVNYIKLHLTSLEQDSAESNCKMDSTEDLESDEYKVLDVMDISINGQIIATAHLLSVVADILGIELEEK